ncbi:MAG TPA: chemotaxis protein CheW [Longimicrobiales bacterium]
MAMKSAAPASPHRANGTAPVWAVFGCGDRTFGFPLDRVREILFPRPITRLPGCGPEVCGLIGLRGRIVTVLDVGAALGLRPAVSQPDHRLLVVECGDRLVAGAVETVAAIRPVAVRPIGRLRAVLRGIAVDRGAVLGVGRLDGEPFLALDSDAVLGALLL